jgi:hypothetical protein
MKLRTSVGRRCLLSLASASVGLTLIATQTQAQIVTLSDQNSFAQINTSSQAGMFNWNVQGVNQLYQQWFWYRIGSVGPEHSIDTISAPSLSLFLGTRGMAVTYTAPTFTMEVDYQLTGGSVVSSGSAQSDIQETVRIHNTSANTINLHLFQYSDFDLEGAPGGDIVKLGTDTDGKFNSATQTKGLSTMFESMTVDTPSADHGQVDFYPTMLNSLNDGNPTTLNDNGGPVGPGDVTWGLEWDPVLNPNDTFILSKDKHLSIAVPEPSSAGLVLLGLACFGWIRRRQS